ncbi:endonuclease III, partial [Candidatus Thorarchaeota archaeon]
MSAKKAQRICDILVEEYGDKIATRRLPAIDELVLTILSQNTSDVNTSRAFKRLNERFSNWEGLLAAPNADVEDAIRVSGFFRIKTERIKAALSEIKERVGALDLSHLEDMPLADAKEWLTSLHGVGPKTAAIVLLFSFGRAALPVDTHVWRVTKRLG